MKKYVFSLFFLVATLAFSVSSTLAQGNTLAITPFTVTSESNLSYLETGLIDLFSSRLALNGKVDIADKAKVIELYNSLKAAPETLVPGLAEQTQADYVVMGSLDESSKGIVLHVFVLDPAKKEPVLDLRESSGDYETADVVIPLVDAISAKINRDLFAREIPEEAETREPDMPYDVHAHPDKLLEFVPKDKKK